MADTIELTELETALDQAESVMIGAPGLTAEENAAVVDSIIGYENQNLKASFVDIIQSTIDDWENDQDYVRIIELINQEELSVEEQCDLEIKITSKKMFKYPPYLDFANWLLDEIGLNVDNDADCVRFLRYAQTLTDQTNQNLIQAAIELVEKSDDAELMMDDIAFLSDTDFFMVTFDHKVIHQKFTQAIAYLMILIQNDE